MARAYNLAERGIIKLCEHFFCGLLVMKDVSPVYRRSFPLNEILGMFSYRTKSGRTFPYTGLRERSS